MLGLMQDQPLMISSLIDHAAAFHSDTEIVSRLPEGPVRRTNWSEVSEESKQVANALPGSASSRATGSARWRGTATGTSSCTSASPASGAVMHTINPRLFAEQIVYIINHAEDRLLFFDITFAPLVEQLAPQMTSVKRLSSR